MHLISSLPIFTAGNASGWFIDTRSHRMAMEDSEAEIDKITRRNREQAAADAKRAAGHKEERERLAQQRRLQVLARNEKQEDVYRVTKRIFEIESRVKKLEAEVLSGGRENRARADLAYARAQLFWTKNTKPP